MARRANDIRRLRYDAGLSAEALAFRAGVSTRTIARVEAGDVIPHPATAKKIADVLGVTPTELLGPAPEPKEAA